MNCVCQDKSLEGFSSDHSRWCQEQDLGGFVKNPFENKTLKQNKNNKEIKKKKIKQVHDKSCSNLSFFFLCMFYVLWITPYVKQENIGKMRWWKIKGKITNKEKGKQEKLNNLEK